MAGIALDRELTRASATRFAVAAPADDAAIRRLLRENPMPGAVSLSFEREPDYFLGAGLAGGEDQTIVAYSGERLLCMGRGTTRECWIDGAARRTGYLAELRLDATARGRFAILRDGYRFFHTLQRDQPASLYFTSIAADNEPARRLLERGARGLPAYAFLAELDTLLVTTPSRAQPPKLRLEPATPELVPEMLRVLNRHAQPHQLASVWSAESLRALERQGLPLERFLLARDAGEIVACGAVWDQRGFRQTVIRGYAPIVSAVRPLASLASRLLGGPRLPPPGSILAHSFLSPLAFAPGAEALLPDFIEAAFPLAREIGAEFLTLALPSTDARLPRLRRRFSTRAWRSRLYRVDWPGDAPFEFHETSAAFLPDTALL